MPDEIRVDVPAGAKILVLQFQQNISVDQFNVVKEAVKGFEDRIREAARRDDWPVTLLLGPNIDVRWLEAEKADPQEIVEAMRRYLLAHDAQPIAVRSH